MTVNPNLFRQIACVVLGATTGFLIVLPLTGNGLHWIFIALFASMGAFAGYRRRNSTFFFYFCLISVLLLSSLVWSSFSEPG